MAKKEEEKRDPLFSTNLGGGLIDIDESPEAGGVVSDKSEDSDGKKKDEDQPVMGEGFQVNEDGTIEIDEHLQKTIDASKVKLEEEEDQEDIDKTESKTKESSKEDQGKETPSDGDGSSDSSSPSSSPFLAFARDRAKEGVFLDFDTKDWDTLKDRNNGDEAAALRELSTISMREMIKQGIEQYKESLTDEDRALYEAKEKGLPLGDYGVAQANYKKYSAIKKSDLKDNEKLQVEVVSKALEVKGFTPDEIAEEIEGYKSLENLESKAEKAVDGLPSYFKKEMTDMEEDAAADEQTRKDNLRQRVARMKRLVDQTPEIIPGIELNKNTRDSIMKSMTIPVATDEYGNPMNPVMATRAKNTDAFEMLLHYYHQLGLFNIDDNGVPKPDFSKIAKVEKRKAVDELKQTFEVKDKQVAGKPGKVKTQEDALKDFDAAFNRL